MEEMEKKIAHVVWEAMQFARGCSPHCWETQPNAHKNYAKDIVEIIEAAHPLPRRKGGLK